MYARYTSGAITLLLGISACGTAATLRPRPAPALARLNGTVSVAGGYAVHGDFSTAPAVLRGALPTAAPAGYTCADYAHGSRDPSGASTFVSPQMQTAGASSVYVQITLASGYRGPSTYDSTTAPVLTGIASITIPPASAPVIDTFRSSFYGSVTLTVRPDGSGSVTITDWGSPGSDSRISGTASWSCTEPLTTGVVGTKLTPDGGGDNSIERDRVVLLDTPSGRVPQRAARGATNPRDWVGQPLSIERCERRDGRAPNEMAGRLAPCTWCLASLLERRDRRASGAW
jgi:hypothetical protein